jgi:hypothetical protein
LLARARPRSFSLVLGLVHGACEPGVEELDDNKARQTQLLGDVGLVLGDGRAHVRLADQKKIAVLVPVPGGRLPEVRIAAETARMDDWRRER